MSRLELVLIFYEKF